MEMKRAQASQDNRTVQRTKEAPCLFGSLQTLPHLANGAE